MSERPAKRVKLSEGAADAAPPAPPPSSLHGTLAARPPPPPVHIPPPRPASAKVDPFTAQVNSMNPILGRLDVDGSLFSDTALGAEFLAEAATALPEVKRHSALLNDLAEVFDTWEVNTKHRTDLYRLLERAHATISAASRPAFILRDVKLLAELLDRKFKKIHAKHSPEWLAQLTNKIIDLENNPYMKASTTFMILTDYPATTQLRDRYTKLYLPYFHDQLQDRQQRIVYRKEHAALTKQTLAKAEAQRDKIFRLTDFFFTQLMPSAGLELGYIKDAERELRGLKDRKVPLLASDAARRAAVMATSKRLPPPDEYEALFGRKKPEWLTDDDRTGEVSDPVDITEFLGERWIDLDIPAIRRLLTNAFQVLTRGPLNRLGEGGGGGGGGGTDLSISRDFLRAVKDLLGNQAEGDITSNTPFDIDLASLRASQQQRQQGAAGVNPVTRFTAADLNLMRTNFDNLSANVAVNRLRVLVGPYAEGALYEPSQHRLRYFNLEKLRPNAAAAARSPEILAWNDVQQRLVQLFKEIDRTLLRPDTGLWDILQLDLNPTRTNPQGENLQKVLSELETERILRLRSEGRADAAARDELLDILRHVQTGTRLSELIRSIRSADSLKDALKKDDTGELAAYHYLLRFLSKFTRIRFNPESKHKLDTPLPLQYHYDGRFGMLYAVIQYSYLRLVLQRTFAFIAEPTLQAHVDAVIEYEEAEREVGDENKRREDQIDTLRKVAWDLEPINLPPLAFDPVVARCLDLAFQYLVKFSRNSVKWDKKDVARDITVREIVKDTSPEGEAALDFLLRLAAWQYGQGSTQMTSKKPNTATKHHLERGVMVEAEWQVRCGALKAKYDPDSLKYRLIVPPF